MIDRYNGRYKTQCQTNDSYCENCHMKTKQVSDGGYWFCERCGKITGMTN